MARRAKVFEVRSQLNSLSAKHTGYRKIGIIHQRSFSWYEDKILIIDSLSKSSKNKAVAYFHFHSGITKPILKQNKVILEDKNISILFSGFADITISAYELCQGFNKTTKAFKLIVSFDKDLKTQIKLLK